MQPFFFRWRLSLSSALMLLIFSACNKTLSTNDAQALVGRWAKTVESGQNADKFWADPGAARQLGSVRSCKIVSASRTGDDIPTVSVQIESSQPEGNKSETWDFLIVKSDGDWKISDLVKTSGH